MLATLCLLAAVLALGDNGFLYKLLRPLPQITYMNFPIKFVVLIVFGLPLLAAFSLKWCLAFSDSIRILGRFAVSVWVLCAVTILGIVWFAYRNPIYYEQPGRVASNGLIRIAFLTLTLFALLAIKATRNHRRQILAANSLLFLIWCDIATHVPRQNPAVPISTLQGNIARFHSADAALAERKSRAMLSSEAQNKFERTFLTDARNTYLGQRLGLYYNCNLLEGIPKADGFFPLYLREPFEVSYLLYSVTNGYSPVIADLMAISEVSAENNPLEWQARHSYLPLATAGQRPVFLRPDQAVYGLLHTNFVPTCRVILPVEAQEFIHVTNATDARILACEVAPHRIEIDAEASEPSMLVLSQSYYHPWRALVNGKPAKLWRANHAFQALEIPAGKPHIQVIYRDRSFMIGSLVSLVSLLFCAWVAWRPPYQGTALAELDSSH